MAAYMIFVEGAAPTEVNQLTTKYGIQEIEEGASRLTWLSSQDGPSGKPGMLGFWMDSQDLRANTYEADSQKWVVVPNELGGLWLGTLIDEPLKPDDILKLAPYQRSIPCLLEDGNSWSVPIAKWLPHVWGQDAKGSFVRQPADAFTTFCAEAERVFQFFVAAGTGEGDFAVDCQWSFICRALSLNYRLAPAIISALKLVGDYSGGRILAATVELQLSRDVEDQKKSTG